jgi:hypothetical protein
MGSGMKLLSKPPSTYVWASIIIVQIMDSTRMERTLRKHTIINPIIPPNALRSFSSCSFLLLFLCSLRDDHHLETFLDRGRPWALVGLEKVLTVLECNFWRSALQMVARNRGITRQERKPNVSIGA